jgi:hypothetical protein
MRKTGLFHVVKPDSANPGLPSDPVPVDADHYGLASPKDRNDQIYRLVRDFLQRPVATAHGDTLLADAIQTQPESIDAMAVNTGAKLDRIEKRLATDSFSRAAVSSNFIDAEVDRRLTVIRKSRFVGGINQQELALKLAKDLLEDELYYSSVP